MVVKTEIMVCEFICCSIRHGIALSCEKQEIQCSIDVRLALLKCSLLAVIIIIKPLYNVVGSGYKEALLMVQVDQAKRYAFEL